MAVLCGYGSRWTVEHAHPVGDMLADSREKNQRQGVFKACRSFGPVQDILQNTRH